MPWKYPRVAEKMWLAMRAVYEGAQATPELLAEISGRTPEGIARRIEAEGWRTSKTPRQARVLRLVDRLTERFEAMPIGGSGDAARDRAQLGLMQVQVKVGERMAAAALRADALPGEDRPSDEDIAEVLQRINERIVELAREFARELPDQIPEPELAGKDGQGS